MLSARVTTLVAVAALAAGIVAGSATAHADIIALFTLNDTLDVTKYGAVTTPTLTLNGWPQTTAYVGGTPFIDADGESHSGGNAATWENTSSGNASWVLDVDTRMFEDLSLRFDNRSSGASGAHGATSVDIAWAIDGGPFTNVQTLDLNSMSEFTGYTIDLSGIAEIQNAEQVRLRGIWADDSGTGTRGTRLDNVQLTGTPVVDTLAFFPFTGNSPADTANADNVIVSVMGHVGGENLNFTSNEARLAGLNSSDGGYYTFTMTPNPGYELLLYSFEFLGEVGSGTENFIASMVIDGNETELISGELTDSWALQEFAGIGVATTSPVEFRIRGYNFSTSAKTLRIDDVMVTGIVVPEPSTLLLLGIGMVGLLGFRRCKRRPAH